MKIKIIGGCYEYWYTPYYNCVLEFEIEKEDQDSYWVKPIKNFEYPVPNFDYLFKDGSMPIAKCDLELISR